MTKMRRSFELGNLKATWRRKSLSERQGPDHTVVLELTLMCGLAMGRYTAQLKDSGRYWECFARGGKITARLNQKIR